ncbi:MAG TPA: alanine racemase [Anaeromyxobacteraceae bacterium]|nr:alanine racemase [Anaeromyxobacteraceae bacterium]
MPIRPTLATVDLDAVAHNYRLARELAGRPAIAVVKADAYGHGAVPVARRLAAEGAPWLAVALVEEGLELRAAGIPTPILVLGAAYGDRYDLLVENRLTPLVFRREHLDGLAAAARAAGVRASAHLKLDTGMGRIGLAPEEVGGFLDAARLVPEVALEGVCTHFASADLEDRALTTRQVVLFNQAAEAMLAAGLPLRFRHLANSAGTIEYPDAWQDLTRPGIMLYGYVPFAPPGPVPPRAAEAGRALRPALRWSTAITHVKTVPAGTAVSYGGRWVAPRASRIATLPIGYADGYHRRLSGRPGFGCAEVLVRGRRAPIAGTVCMDMCMVDVTEVPGVEPGEEVVLLGDQGGERIDADELAAKAGTISYEILCNVGARVPRAYTGEAR